MTPSQAPDRHVVPHEPQDSLAVDRIHYLADMIAELRELAAREGLPTLAGLLALAYVDAKQQIRRRSGDDA